MPNQLEVKRLRAFLEAAKLTPEERGRLGTLLAQAEAGDEVALARIKQLAVERGGYQSVPGKDFLLPPGPRMVCPENPAHYQDFQREAGEILLCPVHHVLLIPEK